MQGSPATVRLVRVGSAVLAAEMAVIGIPASLAPVWFFSHFPFGRGWVASTGPYNAHSILDLGYFAAALAIVLAWSAARPALDLCRAALVAALVANVAHTAFHLRHGEGMAPGDAIAQGVSLVALTLVNLLALLLTVHHPAAFVPREEVR